MKVLAIVLWLAGVGILIAACFPNPFWALLLVLSVVLTGAAAVIAMSAAP
jgi:hypothetical protein